MKLPNADRAVVGITKLRDYCLDPDHWRGKHKARAFASALGLKADDADVLRDAILTTNQLVVSPGVPTNYPNAKKLITEDCIRPQLPRAESFQGWGGANAILRAITMYVAPLASWSVTGAGEISTKPHLV